MNISFQSIFIVILFFFSGCSLYEKKEIKICIQPFNGAERSHVILVQKALEKYYNTKVTVFFINGILQAIE